MSVDTIENDTLSRVVILEVEDWAADDGARNVSNLIRIGNHPGGCPFEDHEQAFQVGVACLSDVVERYSPDFVLLVHTPLQMQDGEMVSGFFPGQEKLVLVSAHSRVDMPLKTVCLFDRRWNQR